MNCPDGACIARTLHLHHKPSVRSKRYTHCLGIVDKANSPKGIEHNEAHLCLSFEYIQGISCGLQRVLSTPHQLNHGTGKRCANIGFSISRC